jgi:hypothetical protein
VIPWCCSSASLGGLNYFVHELCVIETSKVQGCQEKDRVPQSARRANNLREMALRSGKVWVPGRYPAWLGGGLCALAVLLAGCGGNSDETPVACLDGAGAYLGALGDAPGEVRLSGEVPIGECLAENQKGGDLAAVGAAMLDVATQLNAESRQDPGGDANLELGYLLGAAERGAERSGGIHADLVRRLAVAARYSPGGRPLPPAFLRTYREGFDAGRAQG